MTSAPTTYGMLCSTGWVAACCVCACTLVVGLMIAPPIHADHPPTLTSAMAVTRIGQRHTLPDVVIPGSQREARPLHGDDRPLVLRVASVFPHGDGFRYDLEFYGQEAGTYDLLNYLQPLDGSQDNAESLSPILVEVRGVLPPGQIQPHPLTRGAMPRFGRYGVWATTFAVAWLLGLLAILLWRPRVNAAVTETQHEISLQDLLASLLSTAAERDLSDGELAECERLLVASFREQAGLTEHSHQHARQALQRDSRFGPLMSDLEGSLHRPHAHRVNAVRKVIEQLSRLQSESAVTNLIPNANLTSVASLQTGGEKARLPNDSAVDLSAADSSNPLT